MHDTRRVRLVLAVLLVAAIALITIDFRDGGTSSARGAGSGIFGPVERVASDVTSPVSSVFDWVTGGPSSDSKIASLQAANAKLRAELSQAQLSKADESQLSALLRLAGQGGYKVVAASVIAAGQDYSDTVTLDVGRKDGVRAHETVLNGQGLVGTVTQVSSDTSTVLLATDAVSVVGARMAGNDQIGSITGTGKSLSGPTMLQLKLFDGNAILQVGQDLVTFGSVHNTPYVPGVPIGQVTKVEGNAGSLTQTALVKPFVNFTSLGVVGVVVGGPAQDPHDAVLPTAPKPAPTVTVTVTPGAPSQPATSGGTTSGGTTTGG
ncbi:MAG TPA: rod shape-determining protein MreC [Streptosporangiaceae bacterium]|jgi:rod shape-determining protein MreC